VGSQKLGQVKAVTGGQLVKLRAAGETVGQHKTFLRSVDIGLVIYYEPVLKRSFPTLK
jgi:hypothetical protein